MSKVNASLGMFEGQSAIIKARITDDSGTMVSSDGASSTTQATAVSCKVFDQRVTPATVLNDTTTVVVATAFVAGATGYLTTGWELDSDGYNFALVIPDASGLGDVLKVDWEGGHTYIAEITVTTGATISPGSQAEGPVTFRVEIKVDSMLGVS